MNPQLPTTAAHREAIAQLILSLRNQRVILDADLARLYGVETRALNQAMKRNQDRFPADFMFDLAREEILRISQTVTSLRRLKFSKQVRAFTEHGALMAANGDVLTVTREGNHLFAQLTGQSKCEIYPESETNYFWKVVDAQVTFVKDATGKVTKAIHHQNGRTFDAPKIQ